MATGYFVTKQAGNNVQLYPLDASGSPTPTTELIGGSTLLAYPLGCVCVGTNLWVANGGSTPQQGNILRFPITATGDATPTVNIDGGEGNITTLNDPFDVNLDSSGNIYVANFLNASILTFAPTANGVVAPIKTIVGGSTGLVLPVSVALDSIGQIYVVDEGNSTVLSIFAAGANGNVAPTATITGSLTGLYNPICVRIDTANNIWVCNGADGDGHIATILKFAAGTTGNTAAVNTLSNAALQP